MRKGWIALLAVALVAAIALPAAAEVNLTGFVRTKGWVTTFDRFDAGTVIPVPEGTPEAAIGPAAPSPFGRRILAIDTSNSAGYVETRGRLRFEAKGENVGAVAFFEIDGRWGDASYSPGGTDAPRNRGFGLEGDSINLETKNLYVWFKPSEAMTVNVGLQGFMDSYRGIIFGVADMAGVFVTGKFAPVDYRLGWAKLQEAEPGGVTSGVENDQDVDFYVAEAHFAPMPDTRLGANLYYIRDSRGTALAAIPDIGFPGITGLNRINSYYVGVDGSIKLAPATLSAFFLYNFGEFEFATGDLDIKAWAADVRADLDLGPGKFFIEGLYVTGNSDLSDWETLVTGSTWALAGSFYFSTDMQILFPNIDDINSSAALAYDVANLGSGLIHVGAGYTQSVSDKVKFKVGAGWLQAAEDFAFADKDQAIEINANVNYNLAKGLDFGVYGAYAFLGDAYSVAGFDDPDDPYSVYARLNYAF